MAQEQQRLPSSPLAVCSLLRAALLLLREDPASELRPALFDLLVKCLRHANDVPAVLFFSVDGRLRSRPRVSPFPRRFSPLPSCLDALLRPLFPPPASSSRLLSPPTPYSLFSFQFPVNQASLPLPTPLFHASLALLQRVSTFLQSPSVPLPRPLQLPEKFFPLLLRFARELCRSRGNSALFSLTQTTFSTPKIAPISVNCCCRSGITCRPAISTSYSTVSPSARSPAVFGSVSSGSFVWNACVCVSASRFAPPKSRFPSSFSSPRF